DKAAAAEAEMLAKIAKMPDGDRQMAERFHSIVTAVAPHLSPKLYYGQPAYARDGKVVVFFRSGQMDKERYSTFGVTQHAALDDASGLWATSYALAEPTEEAWTQLTMIVKQAAEHARGGFNCERFPLTHRRILRINRLVPGGGTRSSRRTQPRSGHQHSLIGSHQAHTAASCRATVKRHRVVA